MINNNIIFIDFDSTFIKLETLDELAKLVLKNDKERNLKIKQITEIINQAMSGNINFTKALNLRLQLLKINKTDVDKITNHLSKSISESINSNIDLIRLISENIWIVSGGFKDIIAPIVKNFGIKKVKSWQMNSFTINIIKLSVATNKMICINLKEKLVQ